MQKIVLASASPRRQELLRQIGIAFDVVVKPIDETLLQGVSPQEAVCELAYRKARIVRDGLKEGLIIGADTVVVHKGEILGKPVNDIDAFETLRKLSGGSHQVITGFCVIDAGTNKTIKASETTQVVFRALTDTEVRAYVLSGEPGDKAGSYGIQGLGAVLVDRIEGCYFNVVGLPLTRLAMVLKEFGIEILK